jgi:hypothetical protein
MHPSMSQAMHMKPALLASILIKKRFWWVSTDNSREIIFRYADSIIPISKENGDKRRRSTLASQAAAEIICASLMPMSSRPQRAVGASRTPRCGT